jgi:hypothetical protein
MLDLASLIFNRCFSIDQYEPFVVSFPFDPVTSRESSGDEDRRAGRQAMAVDAFTPPALRTPAPL